MDRVVPFVRSKNVKRGKREKARKSKKVKNTIEFQRKTKRQRNGTDEKVEEN